MNHLYGMPIILTRKYYKRYIGTAVNRALPLFPHQSGLSLTFLFVIIRIPVRSPIIRINFFPFSYAAIHIGVFACLVGHNTLSN